jgi:hypothetical protein
MSDHLSEAAFASLTEEDRYARMMFLLDSSRRQQVLSEPKGEPDEIRTPASIHRDALHHRLR